LQLKKILTVVLDLGLFDLTDFVLIAFAERLSYVHSPNPYCCVPVVERVQQYSKPLASLSLQCPCELASVLRALRIVLHVVAVVSPKHLQR